VTPYVQLTVILFFHRWFCTSQPKRLPCQWSPCHHKRSR